MATSTVCMTTPSVSPPIPATQPALFASPCSLSAQGMSSAVFLPPHAYPNTVRMPYRMASDVGPKLDFIMQKLSSLDSIVVQQQQIISRLDLIEKNISVNKMKMSEIEASQKFLSDKYDNVIADVNVNKSSVKKLQGDSKVTSHDHAKIVKENQALREDIIDLQCRSMRDNLLFFGLQESTLNVASAGENITGESMDGIINSTSSSHVIENCVSKVHEFCETRLGIADAANAIQIDRAHRIGRRGERPRPIVVKFVRSDHKEKVKEALKDGKLRNTPYAVNEQYPDCVRERRRELIPIMIDARKRGRRAVLVRDKLYINGKLYSEDQR